MFETKGTLNEDNLKEICNRLYPRWIKGLFFIIVFYVVIKLMIEYANYNYIGIVICYIMLASLITCYFVGKKLHYSRFIKVIDELYDKRELEFKIEFDDNGVNINNLISGGQGSIAYSSMDKLFNMNRIIIIMCKSGQWFVVFTSC
ncbi:MAG: hypothetical protein RR620_14335, partial [Clostridium sp.]